MVKIATGAPSQTTWTPAANISDKELGGKLTVIAVVAILVLAVSLAVFVTSLLTGSRQWRKIGTALLLTNIVTIVLGVWGQANPKKVREKLPEGLFKVLFEESDTTLKTKN